MNRSLLIGFLIGGLLLAAGSVLADRTFLSTDEVLNESASKKPKNVQLDYRAVTATTSVSFTDLTSASEIWIQNKYDTNLCVKIAAAGETCTAACTGNYIKLEQDESIALPVPRGTSSDSGATSSWGSVCGIMQTAPTNSKGVQTVQRDQ